MKLNENIELHGFQIDGVDYAYRKKYSVNAYEMGLGKSVVSIALAIKAQVERVLVVCPAFLCINWRREISKFCDSPERFTVVSYNGFAHIKEAYDFVVFDEAHYLKNLKAKRTIAAHKYIQNKRPEYMLALSGTPIKNHVPDLYSLLKMCHRGENFGAFDRFGGRGGYWDFCRSFTNEERTDFGIKWEGIRNIPQLKSLISHVYLRKRAEQVLDLPDVSHIPMYMKDGVAINVELKKAFEAYETNAEDLEHFTTQKAINALSKTKFTVDHVKDLLEQTDRVVVFTDHVQAAHEIADGLGTTPRSLITGATNNELRSAAVDALNEGRIKVIVSTIAALSVGVNITSCNYMVFNDFSWGEADMEQARKRIHRIGQAEKCFYYYMYSSDIDEHIHKKLMHKRKLIAEI